MITVLSQDRKTCIKTNVFTIEGTAILGYSNEYCPHVPNNAIHLASYSTEERAKEVLNHLTKVMGSGTNKLYKFPAM
ncbi:MAG TPA: hypothetical protein DD391_07380 [Clostridiales bacterium]|jgi:hypothetical protein|nr:hypothetical protein [Clostridiales bacterium]HBL82401.1 hypothetical protein [Clostridiales bacterium]